MASDGQDCRNTKRAFTSHTFHHGWHLMDKIVVTLNVMGGIYITYISSWVASDGQDCRNTKRAFTSHTFHHGWHLMDKIVVTLNVHLHHIHFIMGGI